NMDELPSAVPQVLLRTYPEFPAFVSYRNWKDRLLLLCLLCMPFPSACILQYSFLQADGAEEDRCNPYPGAPVFYQWFRPVHKKTATILFPGKYPFLELLISSW